MGTKTWQTVGYEANPKDIAYITGEKMNIVPCRILEDISELDATNVFPLCRVPLDGFVRRIHAVSGVVKHDAADDNDFGFYVKNADGTYTAIDADLLIDGADFKTAALAARDLLGLNTSLDRTKTVRELLGSGYEDYVKEVWLCMTMNEKETTSDKVLDFDVMIEYN